MLTWKETIIKVLEEAGRPLHYAEITQIIGDRGLKDHSAAMPANTVNRELHSMSDPDDPQYDRKIRKCSKAVFELVTTDSPRSVMQEQEFDNEERENDHNHIIRVHAFGLHWEKDRVRWNSGKILGCQPHGSLEIDFADQQGVYLLHNNRSVAYVGRTTDSLYQRLRLHNSDKDHKSARWDCFSWFGFRDVEDDGKLKPMPAQVKSNRLIDILEAVLIEALEPPINGRRGDHLGTEYNQVTDPEIVETERRAHFQRLAS